MSIQENILCNIHSSMQKCIDNILCCNMMWHDVQLGYVNIAVYFFIIQIQWHAIAFSWDVLCRYGQNYVTHLCLRWVGWGCEVFCGGHHWQRGKTTTGSALAVAGLDFTQKLTYLVHNMNRSQLYIWGLAILAESLLFSVNNILEGLCLNCNFICWNYSLSSGWHNVAA